MKNPTSIRALFALPGFVATSRLVGLYGDRYARVLVLRRRKKLRPARSVATDAVAGMTSVLVARATSRPPGFVSTSSSSAGGSPVPGVAACL